MKTDLLTSIVAGITGFVIAYLATNFLIGPIESFSYKTVDGNVDANLVDPDPEIFNYRSLNPTVEVYVGECEEYNDYGECIDHQDEYTLEENADNNNKEETDKGDSNKDESSKDASNKEETSKEEPKKQEGQENE